MRGGGRDTLYKTGIEYVVNKQDVVEYTKTIRKYCGIAGLADRWKEEHEHEDKGN